MNVTEIVARAMFEYLVSNEPESERQTFDALSVQTQTGYMKWATAAIEAYKVHLSASGYVIVKREEIAALELVKTAPDWDMKRDPAKLAYWLLKEADKIDPPEEPTGHHPTIGRAHVFRAAAELLSALSPKGE